MRYRLLAWSCTICLLSISFLAFPQQLQSVNKQVTKNIPLAVKELFRIAGEKADISVTGWEKDFVQVRLTMTAENASKTIAEKELNYIQYAIARGDDGTVTLQNAFMLPYDVDQINSRLTVSMEIMFPEKQKLFIENKYGSVNLSNLSGSIQTSVRFNNVSLERLSGQLHISAAYSEIRGEALRVNDFVCDAEKTTVELVLTTGRYVLKGNLCDMDLTVHEIGSLNIEVLRTPITLRPANSELFSYDLRARSGTIHAPAPYKASILTEGKQASLRYTPASSSQNVIRATTTYNSITIK